MIAEVAPRRRQRRPVDERRDEDEKHDFRIEARRRQLRHECERESADDEQNRCGTFRRCAATFSAAAAPSSTRMSVSAGGVELTAHSQNEDQE